MWYVFGDNKSVDLTLAICAFILRLEFGPMFLLTPQYVLQGQVIQSKGSLSLILRNIVSNFLFILSPTTRHLSGADFYYAIFYYLTFAKMPMLELFEWEIQEINVFVP